MQENQLKEKFKVLRDSWLSFRYEDLIKLAANKQIISFDLFDTLVKRDVRNPSDIFKMVEEKYSEEYIYHPVFFTNRRITAEKKARALSRDEEISIEDIYDNLQGFDNEQKQVLKRLELSLEYDAACPNIYLCPFVRWCREHNKKIICVSDIYLSKKFIASILCKCGYTDIDSVFISSEYKKTKATGTLFQIVLDFYKIHPTMMLHIGDSKHSDFIMPQKFGISAYQIPLRFVGKRQTGQKFVEPSDRFRFTCLQGFIDNHLGINKNEFYQFGYEHFGMLLWGFSSWLYHNLKENNIARVYFFSRDGFIMKKAFDLEYSWDKKIQTYYLKVSRRSLRIPILWMNPDLSTLLKMISPSAMIPLASIFDGVGLNIEDYSEIVHDCGFSTESILYRNSIMNDDNLKTLYEEIKPDFVKKSKSEFDNLAAYIRQMKLSGKFGVVDIGWSGGMQKNLCKALDWLCIKYEIFGYYFGIANYVQKNISDYPLNLKGYLFDFSSDANADDSRSSFVGLFETLFLEQDGSVKNYTEKNNKIIAQRYPYEYRIGGVIQPEAQRVADLQKGALAFIQDIAASKLFTASKFSPITLFSGIRSIGASPQMHDVRLWGDFRFFDEGQEEYLAKPRKKMYYVLHPKRLKQDFLKSRWKVGFMKRLCVAPLPYETIYKKVRAIASAEKS